jgi:hypothetical protein
MVAVSAIAAVALRYRLRVVQNLSMVRYGMFAPVYELLGGRVQGIRLATPSAPLHECASPL